MHDKKRTITIDPTLHSSLSKKSARNGKRNKSDAANTIKPRPFIRATTLKKTLLDKIKRHQQQQQQQQKQQQNQHKVNSDVIATHNNGSVASVVAPATVNSDDTFAQTFQDSLLYLQNLSANKKTAKAKLRDNKNISSSIPSTSSSSSSSSTSATASSLHSINSPGPDVNLGAYPSEFANTVVPSIGAMMSMQPMYPPVPMQPMYPPVPMQPINGSNEIDDPPGPPIKINSEPVWGCLKNGSKPTFRTLNGTLKNAAGVSPHMDNNIQLNISDISIPIPRADDVTNTHTHNVMTPPSPSSEQVELIAATNKSIENAYGARKQRLDEYKREHFEAALKNQQPVIKIRETKQQIITKKYKLGKYVNKQGPVIGVLIKNRQTQYNVEKKRNEMRHIPLHTIKSRLHKKNLLKVGSIAPPDILREMYENAVFAGDIENDGEGILLHNFLASASESETEPSHNK